MSNTAWNRLFTDATRIYYPHSIKHQPRNINQLANQEAKYINYWKAPSQSGVQSLASGSVGGSGNSPPPSPHRHSPSPPDSGDDDDSFEDAREGESEEKKKHFREQHGKHMKELEELEVEFGEEGDDSEYDPDLKARMKALMPSAHEQQLSARRKEIDGRLGDQDKERSREIIRATLREHREHATIPRDVRKQLLEEELKKIEDQMKAAPHQRKQLEAPKSEGDAKHETGRKRFDGGLQNKLYEEMHKQFGSAWKDEPGGMELLYLSYVLAEKEGMEPEKATSEAFQRLQKIGNRAKSEGVSPQKLYNDEMRNIGGKSKPAASTSAPPPDSPPPDSQPPPSPKGKQHTKETPSPSRSASSSAPPSFGSARELHFDEEEDEGDHHSDHHDESKYDSGDGSLEDDFHKKKTKYEEAQRRFKDGKGKDRATRESISVEVDRAYRAFKKAETALEKENEYLEDMSRRQKKTQHRSSREPEEQVWEEEEDDDEPTQSHPEEDEEEEEDAPSKNTRKSKPQSSSEDDEGDEEEIVTPGAQFSMLKDEKKTNRLLGMLVSDDSLTNGAIKKIEKLVDAMEARANSENKGRVPSNPVSNIKLPNQKRGIS